MNDFRYAVRMLTKSPGFAAAAVFSLAFAIGLNSIVFTVVDQVVLRSLPVPDPDRVVVIFFTNERGFPRPTDQSEYLEIRKQTRTLSGIIATERHGALLAGEGMPEMLISETVSRNYFSVLGVQAAAGRVFREEDRDAAAEPVVVISHGLWQRRFGGNPHVVGNSIVLSNRSVTLIGVAPPEFHGTDRIVLVDVWFPTETYSMWGSGTAAGGKYSYYSLVGRMRAGVVPDQAQAEMDTIGRRMDFRDSQTGKPVQAAVRRESDDIRGRLGVLGLLLMTVVGLVLLIACSNISSMMLARSQARQKEIAIRLAIGSGRFRVLRQLFTESVVLSVLGAAAGITLVRWGIDLVPALMPALPVKILPTFHLDLRVFVFTIVLSFVATVVFSLVPALRASKPDLVPLLKEDSAGMGGGPKRVWGRNVLVSGQLALSLILLTPAGLLVKSFVRGLQTDLGFERKEMLLASYSTGVYNYKEAQARAYYTDLMGHARAIPGVKGVCLARRAPFALGGGGVTQPVFLPGQDLSTSAQGTAVKFNIVSEGYFQTIGTRILLGRGFTGHEGNTGPGVAIASEAFAKRLLPGEDPIGKVILIGERKKPIEIVGIARDATFDTVGRSPEPYLYFPFQQMFWGEMTLMVETSGNPLDFVDPLLRASRAVDKNTAPIMVTTLEKSIRFGMYDRTILAGLMGTLGLLGLILASFGLYGVVSYTVSRRTHEIGIRMALGAVRQDALRLILGQGLRLALAGLIVGMPLAYLAGESLRSTMYGVSPADPAIIGGTAVLLVGVALLASYIPALRATKVDPMIALRHE